MIITVFTRTLILYVLVVLVMRLMGKRQMGELQPFELVITIMISELAAVPMQNTGVPLLNGIVPILTLLFLQTLITFGTLKSDLMKKLVCGSPTILIAKGRVLEDALRKTRYSLNDLMEQLRIKGYFNIHDIEYAILETDGDISVIPKSQKRPVTPADLGIKTKYEGLPISVIVDGKVKKDILKYANISEQEVLVELKKRGINTPEEVFFACIDPEGNWFVQKKEG
ncbi:protein of unknown function DUF421 [Caldicellulosiruptor saccharolyticus DSM 8903]|uniref:YetF C-terminal domain-containing protein n=1 Tax=Caldicellulosiruptor saccharolyticus (strain ATCC 43494 / DSM 8903 / Tp8T 6331) TaxID=351627 RepID=A4XLB0_CALS8|nr:DUF421 domain-containing protein [Caldicellulosiruptor saccharolyticus]ABP67695.1 protein of unknown function DUF421 [Caldicellulosiruptor saccharolyticus DSM 8903]